MAQLPLRTPFTAKAQPICGADVPAELKAHIKQCCTRQCICTRLHRKLREWQPDFPLVDPALLHEAGIDMGEQASWFGFHVDVQSGNMFAGCT
eukprot:11845785-Karenia_brevis.AAC.1